MPTSLNTIDQLQEYLVGVKERANHHAQQVNQAVLVLAGVVVLFKDSDAPLVVMTRQGHMTNVLWLTMNGRRYALSYDRLSTVEIREGSTRGQTLGTINNNTSISEMIAMFEALRAIGP